MTEISAYQQGLNLAILYIVSKMIYNITFAALRKFKHCLNNFELIKKFHSIEREFACEHQIHFFSNSLIANFGLQGIL